MFFCVELTVFCGELTVLCGELRDFQGRKRAAVLRDDSYDMNSSNLDIIQFH